MNDLLSKAIDAHGGLSGETAGAVIIAAAYVALTALLILYLPVLARALSPASGSA
jgi:hypothetical protein